MRFAEISDRIRHSLWFIPSICTVVGALLALLLVWVSELTGLEATNLPIVFSAGVDGARAMLQAIAGSIMTVTGVLFSITIVALQLASTQFSPRVLRTFLRDRSTQVVLGVFVGTFTYTLLVLRSIRSEDESASAFVPALAITGALVLTLIALGMLIYFIHHISVRIQVTSILASVADDTLETTRRLAERWQEDDDDRPWHPTTNAAASSAPPSGAVPAETVPGSEHLVPARSSGYLQFVDIDRLVEATQEAGGRLRLLVGPGAWVQEGVPLAAFEPSGDGKPDLDDLSRSLEDGIGLGHERSMSEDIAFGIQQIVDIALKAMSPSVNDPTTAMNGIDRLVQVLIAIGTSPDAPRAITDRDATRRLEIPFPTFDELVDLSFDQLRHSGASITSVVVHLARALSMLRSLPPHRHGALIRHARLLADAAAASITLEDERRGALEAIGPLLD